MASNQAEIQRLSDETCKLQIGGEDRSDPKRLEGAWTVIQQKFSQHFDAPSVSDNVQRMRRPLEEAFLTIKAALEQMAQADSHATATPAAPAAAAQAPPDAAATTEAGNALLQQHQQQLALAQQQQQQPQQQQQQLPADANATTDAGNALLQQHQQQLQQQEQQALLQQQQAVASTMAEQYQVGVAPPQAQAGEPGGAATVLPSQQTAGRKKQADCTDEQIMAMGSRSSRRAGNAPY